MQVYGNLFQGRQNVSLYSRRHAFKAGVEVRLNRDTTYFGISPMVNMISAAVRHMPPRQSPRRAASTT